MVPTAVSAFLGGTVTLNGSAFTGATTVNLGSNTLNNTQFQVVNDSTITFNPPTQDAFGVQNVSVTTPNGTSGAMTLNFVETNPPKLQTNAGAFSGITHIWNFGGGANELWFLYIAGDNSTFDLFGFPFLQNWIPWASGVLSSGNGTGSFSQVIPPGLAGITFYSQSLTLDDQNFSFVGASLIHATTILI